MASDALHLDSGEQLFFSRELENISAELFEVPVQALKALQLVPAFTALDVTDELFTYRVWDYSGDASRIKDWSEDAPPANTFGTETSQKLVSFGSSFNYSIDEIKASARYNRPLDRTRAMAARNIISQRLDKIAFQGDSTDLKGFANLSGTLAYTPVTKTAGGLTWAVATSDELLADLNGMCKKVTVDTNEVEHVSRIVLPTSQYELIKTKPRSTTSDTTVLKFFQDTNPGVEVTSWVKLAGAAAGPLDRAIGYNPDPHKVRLLLPMAFEQLPAREKGMGWVVNCRMKTGGVIAPFPKSIVYADGI
jgi:hypothetical protein